MTFESELDRIQKVLGEIDITLAQGVPELRRGTLFADRAETIAGKLRPVLNQLPDPEGPSPRTEWTVKVRDSQRVEPLRSRPTDVGARILDLVLTLLGAGTRIQLCVAYTRMVEREVSIPLSPPMVEGDPARTETARIPVSRHRRLHPIPKEGWATRVREAWLRLVRPSRARDLAPYELVELADFESVSVEVPGMPLERGANATSQALLDRRRELAADVRAMQEFRARHDQEVQKLEQDTIAAKSRANGLEHRVNALRVDPGPVTRIKQAGEDVVRISNELPAVEATIKDLETRLSELQSQIRAI